MPTDPLHFGYNCAPTFVFFHTHILVFNAMKMGQLLLSWVWFIKVGLFYVALCRVQEPSLLRYYKYTISPHMQGLHCVSHYMNFVVQVLPHLLMIEQIENLLQSLHKYFARSPKRHIEFPNLSKIMETKALKII